MVNLLTQETLAQLLTRVRADLLDAAGAHLPISDSVVGETVKAAIFAALRDTMRITTRQVVYEVEVKERTVASQRLLPRLDASSPAPCLLYIKDWESISGVGQSPDKVFDYYKPIRRFTDRVWTATANNSSPSSKYIRGTDYLINYASGAIYIPTTSSIPVGTDVYLWVSYEVDSTIIDLAPLYKLAGKAAEEAQDFIRVIEVEYPVGMTLQSLLSFHLWGDLLFVEWPDMDVAIPPQSRHIAIQCEVDHWIVDGTAPSALWDKDASYYAPGQDLLALVDDLYKELYWSIDIGNLGMYATPNTMATEYQQSIGRAALDLPRHAPLQLFRDYIINLSVTDEPFVMASEVQLGNAYPLPRKPIQPFSEEVWSGTGKTGTKYVRNTDYTLDYSNGRITNLTMSVGTTYYVTYKRSSNIIDISDINRLSGVYRVAASGLREHYRNGFIRVVEVEYPVGQVPRQIILFSVWGDNLYLQGSLYDSSVVRVYWEASPVLSWFAPVALIPEQPVMVPVLLMHRMGTRQAFRLGTTPYILIPTGSNFRIYKPIGTPSYPSLVEVDEANHPTASPYSFDTTDWDAKATSDNKILIAAGSFRSGQPDRVYMMTFNMDTELWEGIEQVHQEGAVINSILMGTVCISIDSANVPYIAFLTPSPRVFKVLWKSGTWSAVEVGPTITGGSGLLIKHDSLDRLHIVAHRSQGAYTRRDGISTYLAVENITANPYWGAGITLDVDSLNKPNIAFLFKPAIDTMTLYHGVRNGTWVYTAIKSWGVTAFTEGSYEGPPIIIDTNGSIHINVPYKQSSPLLTFIWRFKKNGSWVESASILTNIYAGVQLTNNQTMTGIIDLVWLDAGISPSVWKGAWFAYTE